MRMRYVVTGLVAGTDRSWSGQLSGLQTPPTSLLFSLDMKDCEASERTGYPPPASVVVVTDDPPAGPWITCHALEWEITDGKIHRKRA